MLLVLRTHSDLVVARIGIHETQQLMSGRRIHQQVNPGSMPSFWTITQAGIPGMSAGVYAKMSAFRRRNMISSSRSASVSEPPIRMHFSGFLQFSGTRSVASPDYSCCKVVSSRWSSYPTALVLSLRAIWDM
ncbi:hypothetical protein Nepgr_021336 [Nepenthes gracilis]|uniref:Uncharacterized protein n=1 Tax=Nepenthes gracilis TaxID=150966 RepID=A0AAD3SYF8_NEPGR|nr:hypothetical protein Nepgr_021336 [Nepenthes gracilis]